MKFIETILPSLRVWQLFCLSPFALTEKTRWPRIVRSFSIFCIVYIVVESAVLVHGFVFTHFYLDWRYPVVIVYGDLVTMTLARLLAISVVIESWKKRHTQIEFLEKISEVDSILAYRLSIDLRYDANRRETNWKSFVWLVAFCSMTIYFIASLLNNKTDPYFLRFWLLYMGPFFICTLHYHQMVTYVRLVRYRFEAINHFIQSVCFSDEQVITNRDLLKMMQNVVKTIPPKSEYNDSKVMLYKKLVEVRTAYQLLYEASENINTLFRWTLPINIANDFQKGLTNIFLFITFMLQWNGETSNWKKVTGPLIWAMYNIGHILILSSACQQACEEAEMTPALLHQIDFTLSDQQVADLVGFHAAITLIAPSFVLYTMMCHFTSVDSCIFNATGSTEGHLHCIRTTQCRLHAHFYCKHLFIDSQH